MAGKNEENLRQDEENRREGESPGRVGRKPIKVKYISSPMMVKASDASEFKAIVQQLTGQHSPAVAASPQNGSPQAAFSLSFSDPVDQAYLLTDIHPHSFSGFPPLRF